MVTFLFKDIRQLHRFKQVDQAIWKSVPKKLIIMLVLYF